MPSKRKREIKKEKIEFKPDGFRMWIPSDELDKNIETDLEQLRLNENPYFIIPGCEFGVSSSQWGSNSWIITYK